MSMKMKWCVNGIIWLFEKRDEDILIIINQKIRSFYQMLLFSFLEAIALKNLNLNVCTL